MGCAGVFISCLLTSCPTHPRLAGHSYVTFGPLLMGAKQVLFEGVPTYPDAGRCWEVCDKYGVTLFYTAPTAIRTLMACGDQHVTKHKCVGGRRTCTWLISAG